MKAARPPKGRGCIVCGGLLGLSLSVNGVVIARRVFFQNASPTQEELIDRSAWRHSRAIEELAKIPSYEPIVFLGDSITAEGPFSELIPRALNRGIKGDTTSDVLARLPEVTDRRPRQVWLMIGVNDLIRGRTEAQALAGIFTIADRIRTVSPGTRLFVQSLLPIDHRVLALPNVGPSIDRVNAELKRHFGADVFVDMHPDFRDDSGRLRAKYSRDGLHLNVEGYLAWYEQIEVLLSPTR